MHLSQEKYAIEINSSCKVATGILSDVKMDLPFDNDTYENGGGFWGVINWQIIANSPVTVTAVSEIFRPACITLALLVPRSCCNVFAKKTNFFWKEAEFEIAYSHNDTVI